LASDEGAFLNNKYVWANWDVDELIEKKEQIQESKDLEVFLSGVLMKFTVLNNCKKLSNTAGTPFRQVKQAGRRECYFSGNEAQRVAENETNPKT
jgi:CRISPR/Cas system-associated protein Cas5 (RAMP superfamily)